MHALVVDDSRTMRAMLARMLRDIDFAVQEAGHGKEALQLLEVQHRTQPFALVLVDWNMPEMNGYDFVRRVRADDAYRHVRLMMVTTETEMGQVAKALEAGADEYAMKPVTREVILEKLAILGLAVP
jgi:two-component system chemotaxis response regulator CheY